MRMLYTHLNPVFCKTPVTYIPGKLVEGLWISILLFYSDHKRDSTKCKLIAKLTFVSNEVEIRIDSAFLI